MSHQHCDLRTTVIKSLAKPRRTQLLPSSPIRPPETSVVITSNTTQATRAKVTYCLHQVAHQVFHEIAHSRTLVGILTSYKVLSRAWALLEKSNFPALLRLAQELENDELLSSLIGMIQPESFRVESLSLEEAILLLRIIYRQRLH